MQQHINIRKIGADNRPFLVDVYYAEKGNPQPIVIFTHGFKGFKDWGIWEKIACAFVEAGFIFVKYNLSHNGSTVDSPYTFDDLEAFGNNNYSKELYDLNTVIDFVHSQDFPAPMTSRDFDQITLIGHSRGGALSIVQALQDQRITHLITWAAVDKLNYAWQDPNFIAEWKEKGVYTIVNGRTKQVMPLYYQFYQDFIEHIETRNIPELLPHLSIPMLVLGGDEDPVVPVDMSTGLAALAPKSKCHIIPNCNHVFNGSHPYHKPILPVAAQELIRVSLDFMKGQ